MTDNSYRRSRRSGSSRTAANLGDDENRYQKGNQRQNYGRSRTNEGNRRRRRRKNPYRSLVKLLLVCVIILAGLIVVDKAILPLLTGSQYDATLSGDILPDVQLLSPNEYSRPQIPLEQVNGIVVHYVDNPGTTAQENRDYFESLSTGEEGISASSHYIIGLDGELIQCIPLDEVAYASNDRNNDTISIECCHPDESGEFSDKTYRSLVKLVAWLCDKYEIDTASVIRHYDITGKESPKYYVDNPETWDQFLDDVNAKRSLQ